MRVEFRQEIIGLKNKTDLEIPPGSEFVSRKRIQRASLGANFAGVWKIQSAEQMQQRAFSGSRGAAQHQKIAACLPISSIDALAGLPTSRLPSSGRFARSSWRDEGTVHSYRNASTGLSLHARQAGNSPPRRQMTNALLEMTMISRGTTSAGSCVNP